jgi:hypothetical protein
VTKKNGGWIDRVRLGEFGAIPEPLTWQGSYDFSRLIDGYELAYEAGITDLGDFAYRKRLQAEAGGEWIGTAPELWSILFVEHRAARFARIAFDRDPLLDQLCLTLRFSLQILGHEERALLLRFMERERARLAAGNDTARVYALAS